MDGWMIPQTPTKKIIKLNKFFNCQCYFQTYPVLVMCQPLEGWAEATLQVLYQMPWRLGECWYFRHDTSSTLAIVMKRWVEDLKMSKKHYMIGMHMYTSVCFPALDSVRSNVQDINWYKHRKWPEEVNIYWGGPWTRWLDVVVHPALAILYQPRPEQVFVWHSAV